jgi:hypothetical protein
MINKIVIVGGGSSGWISAAFLKKTFPEKEIVVIESPNVPTIGVGESTLADITNFREYLEIDEKEFMRATDASYKMSIKFNDFYNVDSGGFHYPFRAPHIYDTQNGLSDWLEIKAFYPEIPNEDFVRCYFPHAALFENNKYTLNNDGAFGVWNPKSDVAYHMDATKFGSWLRDKYCLPLGVVLLRTEVENASMSEDGISHLILSNGDTISADLYVDCTGFKSLLLGGYLKEPFTSYSDILPNNRSWAAQIQYEDKEKELEGFTNCTALKNGWAWNTPLWSRLGTGYVYSDKYISPEDAKEEFKQYLMSNKMAVPRTRQQVDSLTYKDVYIKVGIHERTWVKNVVAIGLSAGFIEPLESNGLFSVFRFIAALSKSLLREEVSKLDRDVYNYAVKGMFDNFTEFVALHYALSVRRDTEYWTDVSKRTYSKTIENMEPSSLQGVFDLQNRKMFTNIPDTLAGISYISVGMNYHFFDRVTQKLNIVGNNIKPYVDSNLKLFNAKKSQWNKAAENAPSLNKYLEDNIYDN